MSSSIAALSSSAAAPSSSAPATPASTRTAVVIRIRSLAMTARGDVVIPLSCPAAALGGCRGKITIHFADHDEFDRLRGQLTDALTAPRRAA